MNSRSMLEEHLWDIDWDAFFLTLKFSLIHKKESGMYPTPKKEEFSEEQQVCFVKR